MTGFWIKYRSENTEKIGQGSLKVMHYFVVNKRGQTNELHQLQTISIEYVWCLVKCLSGMEWPPMSQAYVCCGKRVPGLSFPLRHSDLHATPWCKAAWGRGGTGGASKSITLPIRGTCRLRASGRDRVAEGGGYRDTWLRETGREGGKPSSVIRCRHPLTIFRHPSSKPSPNLTPHPIFLYFQPSSFFALHCIFCYTSQVFIPSCHLHLAWGIFL